jgi:hypothetical protein
MDSLVQSDILLALPARVHATRFHFQSFHYLDQTTAMIGIMDVPSERDTSTSQL